MAPRFWLVLLVGAGCGSGEKGLDDSTPDDPGGTEGETTGADDTGADTTGGEDSGDSADDTGDSGDPDTEPAPSFQDVTCADATACLYGMNDGDRVGFEISAAGDVNGDGLGDVLVARPLYEVEDEYAGAMYLVHGPVAGDFDLADAQARFVGAPPSWSSLFATRAGDLDGDGYDDLVTGDTLYGDGGAEYLGMALVLLGPASGELSPADADFALLGEAAGDGVGLSMAGGEDLTGDGLADLVVADDAQNPAVHLLPGPLEPGERGISSVALSLVADDAASSGVFVSLAPDLTGDGLADLAMGGMYEGANAGAVLLFAGPISSAGAWSDADARIDGPYTNAFLGDSLAHGDLDGDGHADLVAWTQYGEDAVLGQDPTPGDLYVLAGPLGAGTRLDDAVAVLQDVYVGSADVLLDRDGDGSGELLVGTLEAGPQRGIVGLYSGSLAGSLSVTDSASLLLRGATDEMRLGTDLGSAGDVDGDGQEDVLIGMPGLDIDAGSRGAVALFTEGL